MSSRARRFVLSFVLFPVILGVPLLAGCQSRESSGTMAAAPTSAKEFAAPEAVSLAAPTGAVKTPNPMPRKIIYTAVLEVDTTDFKTAAERLTQSVKANDGYIAETNVSGAAGERKNGTWKIRIPAARYESFLAAAGGIGEVTNSSSTSEDVSEEFYDIQARLKNKRIEEARLVQHLQASTGKLSEILTVEQEISRVRSEIEQMEGRMRFLSHQADFTTVTINLHELETLKRKMDAPSFGSQISQAFVDSFSGLGAFTKNVVLAIAYLLPWAVILAGVGIPARYLWRKRKGKM